MPNKEEQIKEFLKNKEKLKALLNDEEFIDKVSKREATAETYREKFKKLGLEIDDEDAKQIQSTVSKLFEMPTEKIKLDDEFLKDIAGGDPPPSYNIDTPGGDDVSSRRGLSASDKWSLGLGIGIPVAAWLVSGVGYAIAASVYRKRKNKDKF
ncbi:MAG: hypothetical protein IKE05_05005, partial [Clostridia bacterium]|nr:hypothetical protein [Clostridia bacterium]